MTKYRWAPGANVRVKAQAAGEELERIRRSNEGMLTAKTVVEESRPEEAVLHPAFEWRDEIAAEKYREAQARQVINHCVVVTEATEKTPETTVRAYVNTPSRSAYMEVREALGNEELRAEVLARAWSELQSWTKRYRDLEQFAQIVEVIDRMKSAS